MFENGKKPVDAASNKLKGEICATCFVRQGVVSGGTCQNTAPPYGTHAFKLYVSPAQKVGSSNAIAVSA
jgi:hypothetical protein